MVRVLVVEDEVPLAETVRRGLVAAGFAVDVVHDGREGLWAAAEGSYAAVVLDLMLPSMNGYQVVEELRGRGVWTPVLVLTAVDGDLDQAEALDSGADDYLAKPFSFVVLVARLRALVRRGAPERPAVLRVGDLELDPATRRARRGSAVLALTPRELAVLEHLMRRGGAAVSKAELLDAVWDSGFEGDANVVEVYVSYLRRKVDAPFGRGSIQTVRGAGYRIVDDAGAADGDPVGDPVGGAGAGGR